MVAWRNEGHITIYCRKMVYIRNYGVYRQVFINKITCESIIFENVVTIQNHPYSKIKSGWPKIVFLIAL